MLEQVTATLDWLAADLADRLGAGDDPSRLARPLVGVALLGGLAADAIGATGTGGRTLGYVAVALTLSGSGTLWLVVGRFRRRGGGGGTRSLGQGVLEVWLRRLQLAFAAMLLVVVALALAGALVSSTALFARNVAETARLTGLVLAISYALMDDDPGRPEWLTQRRTGDAWGSAN